MRKKNWKEFNKVLKKKKIRFLYHFTDKKNLKSIKKNGGLYSWKYCEKNKIKIKNPGGNSFSRELDVKYSLEKYVRLSFTKNHPMMYIAKNEGRISNPIILKIDPKVIFLKGTRFSNMNAIKTGHSQGKSINDFKKIKFKIIKQKNHFNLSDEDKPYYQAEVLVKSFIPLKYIKNI